MNLLKCFVISFLSIAPLFASSDEIKGAVKLGQDLKEVEQLSSLRNEESCAVDSPAVSLNLTERVLNTRKKIHELTQQKVAKKAAQKERNNRIEESIAIAFQPLHDAINERNAQRVACEERNNRMRRELVVELELLRHDLNESIARIEATREIINRTRQEALIAFESLNTTYHGRHEDLNDLSRLP